MSDKNAPFLLRYATPIPKEPSQPAEYDPVKQIGVVRTNEGLVPRMNTDAKDSAGSMVTHVNAETTDET